MAGEENEIFCLRSVFSVFLFATGQSQHLRCFSAADIFLSLVFFISSRVAERKRGPPFLNSLSLSLFPSSTFAWRLVFCSSFFLSISLSLCWRSLSLPFLVPLDAPRPFRIERGTWGRVKRK